MRKRFLSPLLRLFPLLFRRVSGRWLAQPFRMLAVAIGIAAGVALWQLFKAVVVQAVT